jgi:two-component system response regulator
MRVLLVEDNPDDVAIVERLLEQSGLPVRLFVARDVQQALGRLGSPALPPELVLLDIGLPAGRGFTVLRRMRADARLRDVPVVIVSGSQESRDVSEGLGLGAHSHVLKPLTAKTLGWMAQSVVNYRRDRQTLRRLAKEGGE